MATDNQYSIYKFVDRFFELSEENFKAPQNTGGLTPYGITGSFFVGTETNY